MEPFLKWVGSKRKLAPYIKEIYDYNNLKSVCEPFCGSSSVSLYIQPKQAFLFDINLPVIALFKWIKFGFNMFGIPPKSDKDTYYNFRDEFNTYLTSYKAASIFYDNIRPSQLFMYLNRFGYKGLYRVNKNGKFNVPYFYHNSNLLDFNFTKYRELMKYWNMYHYASLNEFLYADDNIMMYTIPNDCLVYLDPPYYGSFGDYSDQPFNYEEHRKSIIMVDGLDTPTIFSNSYTDEMVSLYEQFGYKIKILEQENMISPKGRDGTFRKEIIAYRNLLLP